MTAKTVDELIGLLNDLYHEMVSAELKHSSLLNRQGRIVPGHEKEDRGLMDIIKTSGDEIRNLIDGYIKELPIKASEKIPTSPARPPVFEAKIEIDLSLVKNSFPVENFSREGYINVPVGDVYVFGNQSIDDAGFPEVYLGGEVVLSKNKDKRSMVAVLAQRPGEIRLIANQWLVGVSISKDDPARIQLQLPIRLHNPSMTLTASRGSWLSESGRKTIDQDIVEKLLHRCQEILTDPIQLWSSEKQFIMEKIRTLVNKYLESWGLYCIPEMVSLVRQYPKNLYEIVLQLARAEQFILDAAERGEKDNILSQIGITNDELIYIQAALVQGKGKSGVGLFQIINDRIPIYGEKSEARDKLIDWLRIYGGANAANYFREIAKVYSFISKPDRNARNEPGLSDIRLSEQVISHAFHNPLIGLGEWLETLE